MEIIALLEKKIEHLLTLIKKLREENLLMKDENVLLKERIIELEDSLLKENKQFEQKVFVAEQAVSDLLRTIDNIVEGEI